MTRHLIAIDIPAPPATARHSPINDERAIAVRDLLAENVFQPTGHDGEFRLALSVSVNKLHLDIADDAGTALTRLTVSLSPLRRIMRDYFRICDSQRLAQRTARPDQIEAIDVGRRGLHNEGAEVLRDQLDGKVKTDFMTSRRLFTLVCALEMRT